MSLAQQSIGCLLFHWLLRNCLVFLPFIISSDLAIRMKIQSLWECHSQSNEANILSRATFAIWHFFPPETGVVREGQNPRVISPWLTRKSQYLFLSLSRCLSLCDMLLAPYRKSESFVEYCRNPTAATWCTLDSKWRKIMMWCVGRHPPIEDECAGIFSPKYVRIISLIWIKCKRFGTRKDNGKNSWIWCNKC